MGAVRPVTPAVGTSAPQDPQETTNRGDQVLLVVVLLLPSVVLCVLVVTVLHLVITGSSRPVRAPADGAVIFLCFAALTYFWGSWHKFTGLDVAETCSFSPREGPRGGWLRADRLRSVPTERRMRVGERKHLGPRTRPRRPTAVHLPGRRGPLRGHGRIPRPQKPPKNTRTARHARMSTCPPPGGSRPGEVHRPPACSGRSVTCGPCPSRINPSNHRTSGPRRTPGASGEPERKPPRTGGRGSPPQWTATRSARPNE